MELPISKGWFEPSRWSFPLNSIFVESIREWGYNCPRKEGKGKGQSHHGQVPKVKITFIYMLLSKTIQPLYWSLKKNQESRKIAKIRASQCWWITRTKLYFIHVCSMSEYSISQHIRVSSEERSQTYSTFQNKLPVVITHSFVKLLAHGDSTQTF